MSTHTLKLLSETYRNIAQAPTQTYKKGLLLGTLEEMIEKEINNIKKHDDTVDTFSPPKPRNLDDEMPF